MTNYSTIKSNSNNFNSKPAYKKNSAPVLPEGTFRSNYVKNITLTNKNKSVHFTFEIAKDSYSGYKIYIKNCPGLTKYSMHQAHYLGTNPHYICWDGHINSFKDANAIMFVWAKNYIKNCLNAR